MYRNEKFLKEFDEQWFYFYEILFKKLFNKNYLLKGYLAIMAIWVLISIASDRILFSETTKLLPDWWLYVAMYSAVLTTGLLFLNIAKHKLRNEYSSILCLLPGNKQRQELHEKILIVGNWKKQTFFCIPFSLVVLIIMIFQDVEPVIKNFLIFMSFCGIFITSVTALGIWIAVSSFLITRQVTQKQNLRLDFIKPSQTPGITNISDMMSLYATLYSTNILVWNALYLYVVISSPKKIPFWNLDATSFWAATSLFLLFFIFLFWYFLHPQLLITKSIELQKQNVLSDIQGRIKNIYSSSENLSQEQLSLLDKYLSLYKEIDNSKSSLPLQNFLGFGTSFLSSITLSILGNIQTYTILFR